MTRGKLIVIEGLDRSGKSTQCEALSETLSPCTLIKFPDRTTQIGGMIDAYLKSDTELDDHAIHLLFSANRWELAPRILKLLESGTNVVLDRYIYSGIVFSVVKGLDAAWCRACDAGLPEPDLVLFLDVSPEVASQRGGFGQERYEVASTQTSVRQEFYTLFSDTTINVRTVDAGENITAVQKQIWKHVTAMFQDD